MLLYFHEHSSLVNKSVSGLKISYVTELGINVSFTHFYYLCTGKGEINVTLQTCACMCAPKKKPGSHECLIMIVINLIIYSTNNCKYLHYIQDFKLVLKTLVRI